MFWIGFIAGGIIIGSVCLAVGYVLGKKEKVIAKVKDVVQDTVDKI